MQVAKVNICTCFYKAETKLLGGHVYYVNSYKPIMAIACMTSYMFYSLQILMNVRKGLLVAISCVSTQLVLLSACVRVDMSCWMTTEHVLVSVHKCYIVIPLQYKR